MLCDEEEEEEEGGGGSEEEEGYVSHQLDASIAAFQRRIRQGPFAPGAAVTAEELDEQHALTDAAGCPEPAAGNKRGPPPVEGGGGGGGGGSRRRPPPVEGGGGGGGGRSRRRPPPVEGGGGGGGGGRRFKLRPIYSLEGGGGGGAPPRPPPPPPPSVGGGRGLNGMFVVAGPRSDLRAVVPVQLLHGLRHGVWVRKAAEEHDEHER